MESAKVTDFVVASNGHCFFCMGQVGVDGELEVASAHVATHSLQCLTRYLKMDLKKVIRNNGKVPSKLFDMVEKSKLKVELCSGCSHLNEKFSEIYHQLEKLEMELGSCLGLMHEKLEIVDVAESVPSLTAGLNSNWNGLLEILNVLRKEAKEKSSQKISVSPRVKIQNLSKKKIKSEQTKLKYNFRGEQFISDKDHDNSNKHDDLHQAEGDADAEAILEKIEMYKVTDDNNLMMTDVTVKTEVEAGPSSNVSNNGRRRMRKWNINSKTGKWKCDLCPMEFNTRDTIRYHYNAVHLKQRYKCVTCNKLFINKPSLEMHQRTSRSCSSVGSSAQKYECKICQKSFARKDILQGHLDGVHLKLKKFACDLCEKKYNTKNCLNDHRRRVHR